MIQKKEWEKIEKELNLRISFPQPKRRQIWWCSLGQNIGSEQNGNKSYERPVLVLRVWGTIFWGIPVTNSDPSGKKEMNPLFYKLGEIPYLSKTQETKYLKGYLVLSQLRAYDARRLQRRILKMETELFNRIREEIRKLI